MRSCGKQTIAEPACLLIDTYGLEQWMSESAKLFDDDCSKVVQVPESTVGSCTPPVETIGGIVGE